MLIGAPVSTEAVEHTYIGMFVEFLNLDMMKVQVEGKNSEQRQRKLRNPSTPRLRQLTSVKLICRQVFLTHPNPTLRELGN